MPKYRRPTAAAGTPIFFTVCLADRDSDLLVREIAHLRACVGATLKQRPFAIDAWVVLPDHMHCIWRLPVGDTGYGRRWAAIKAAFSRHLPAGRKRPSHHARQEKGIWQRRFWEHHIRGEADWARHMEYCWSNPVKHGLVTTPAEWPFSSLQRDIREGRVSPEWRGGEVEGDFGDAP